jgi:hypothetical protein
MSSCCVLACLSGGCSDEPAADGESSSGASSDAECGAAGAKLSKFIASHNRCSSDSDCAIVGDCSHAGFDSVAREFQPEAQRLSMASCSVFDGPTYNAVCKQGKCATLRSVAQCGGAPQQECPSGSQRYRPGCNAPTQRLAEGCYTPCSSVGSSCDQEGYTCQAASIDPCAGKGGSCAEGCSAAASLCLPAPTCELELSVGFDFQRTFVQLPDLSGGASTQLELWLENRTTSTLNVSFDLPCHGPAVVGLSDYDLWGECLAGVCDPASMRTELSLAPRQKLKWRSALVAMPATTCNPQGLAAGTYAPSFVLSGLKGAVACGPAPVALLVGKAAP